MCLSEINGKRLCLSEINRGKSCASVKSAGEKTCASVFKKAKKNKVLREIAGMIPGRKTETNLGPPCALPALGVRAVSRQAHQPVSGGAQAQEHLQRVRCNRLLIQCGERVGVGRGGTRGLGLDEGVGVGRGGWGWTRGLGLDEGV